MKFISSFLVLASLSTSLFAQQIEADINGKKYNCFPVTERPIPAGNQFECTEMAYRGPFTKEESMKLCEGAKNTAPAECALKAYSGPFKKSEAFNLCLKAKSVGPAECALKAFAGPFTKEEAKKLCNFPGATIEIADCAIKAFAGNYTREEALKLCEYHPEETKPEVKPITKDAFEALVIKANEKALRLHVYKK